MPAQPRRDGEGDEVVPPLAGGDVDRHASASSLSNGDAAQIDLQHDAVEAFVGDEDVAAAAEDEERLVLRGGPGHGFADLVDAFRADEKPRRTADAEGGERGERHIPLQPCRRTLCNDSVIAVALCIIAA